MKAQFFIALVSAASMTAGSAALAQSEAEECFDKGDLSYDECPTEPEPVIEVVEEVIIDEPTWTGFYIGAHLGYGEGDFDGIFDSGSPLANPAFNGDLGLDMSPSGFVGGLHFGYRYQFESGFVFGAEVDGTLWGAEDDVSNDDNDNNNANVQLDSTSTEEAEASIDYSASARLQAGYDFGGVLPYVTGGVGLVGYEVTVDNNEIDGNDPDDFPESVTFDEDVFAPVVGAGVDMMLTDDLYVGAQFLYFFIDETHDLNGEVSDSVAGSDLDDEVEVNDAWTVTIRGGFRF